MKDISYLVVVLALIVACVFFSLNSNNEQEPKGSKVKDKQGVMVNEVKKAYCYKPSSFVEDVDGIKYPVSLNTCREMKNYKGVALFETYISGLEKQTEITPLPHLNMEEALNIYKEEVK